MATKRCQTPPTSILCFILFLMPTIVDGLFICTGALWGEWGEWSSCPDTADGTDLTLVASRTRTCSKMPTGCFIGSYSCDGEMSDTLTCGTTTTKEGYSTILIDWGTTVVVDTTIIEETTNGETTMVTEDSSSVEVTTVGTTTKNSEKTTTQDTQETTAAVTKGETESSDEAENTTKASESTDSTDTSKDTSTDSGTVTDGASESTDEAENSTKASESTDSTDTSDDASTDSGTVTDGASESTDEAENTTKASESTDSTDTSDDASTDSGTVTDGASESTDEPENSTKASESTDSTDTSDDASTDSGTVTDGASESTDEAENSTKASESTDSTDTSDDASTDSGTVTDGASESTDEAENSTKASESTDSTDTSEDASTDSGTVTDGASESTDEPENSTKASESTDSTDTSDDASTDSGTVTDGASESTDEAENSTKASESTDSTDTSDDASTDSGTVTDGASESTDETENSTKASESTDSTDTSDDASTDSGTVTDGASESTDEPENSTKASESTDSTDTSEDASTDSESSTESGLSTPGSYASSESAVSSESSDSSTESGFTSSESYSSTEASGSSETSESSTESGSSATESYSSTEATGSSESSEFSTESGSSTTESYSSTEATGSSESSESSTESGSSATESYSSTEATGSSESSEFSTESGSSTTESYSSTVATGSSETSESSTESGFTSSESYSSTEASGSSEISESSTESGLTSSESYSSTEATGSSESSESSTESGSSATESYSSTEVTGSSESSESSTESGFTSSESYSSTEASGSSETSESSTESGSSATESYSSTEATGSSESSESSTESGLTSSESYSSTEATGSSESSESSTESGLTSSESYSSTEASGSSETSESSTESGSSATESYSSTEATGSSESSESSTESGLTSSESYFSTEASGSSETSESSTESGSSTTESYSSTETTGSSESSEYSTESGSSATESYSSTEVTGSSESSESSTESGLTSSESYSSTEATGSSETSESSTESGSSATESYSSTEATGSSETSEFSTESGSSTTESYSSTEAAGSSESSESSTESGSSATESYSSTEVTGSSESSESSTESGLTSSESYSSTEATGSSETSESSTESGSSTTESYSSTEAAGSSESSESSTESGSSATESYSSTEVTGSSESSESSTESGLTSSESYSSTEVTGSSESSESSTESGLTSSESYSSTEATGSSETSESSTESGSSTTESYSSTEAAGSSESSESSTESGSSATESYSSTEVTGSSESSESSTESGLTSSESYSSTEAAGSSESSESSTVSGSSATESYSSTASSGSSETSESSTESGLTSSESYSSTERSESSETTDTSTNSGSSSSNSYSSTEPSGSSVTSESSTESGSTSSGSFSSTEISESSKSSEYSTESGYSETSDFSTASSSSPTEFSTEGSEQSETSQYMTESTAAGITDSTDVVITVIPPESSSESWTTCDDCSQINVDFFNGDPYTDASSVLNRYSVSGCYYVQFFCRPIEIGDTSSVSTILSNDDSYFGAPLNANLACRDQKWVLLNSTHKLASDVTSLGCVYTTKTTKIPKTTTELQSSIVYDSTVSDIPSTENSQSSTETSGQSTSDMATTNSDTATTNYATEEQTTEQSTSGTSEDSSSVITTTESGTSEISRDLTSIIFTTDHLSTTSNSVTENTSTEESLNTEQTTIATTTDIEITTEESSTCDSCVDLEPEASTEFENGMLVLWHYQKNGCNRVSISCQTTTSETESYAALIFNSKNGIEVELDEVEIDLICANGKYSYEGINVISVSCVMKDGTNSVVTTFAPVTTESPEVEDCNGCSRVGVELLDTSSEYQTGLLKATMSYDSCMRLTLTCHGTSDTDQVALIYEDAEMARGVSEVSLNLSCTNSAKWITSESQIIDSISCGYQSTSLITTTEVSETTISSECGACSNMESAEALQQSNTYDGMIVLYNYMNSTTSCKTVDISCRGTTDSENSTLILNPVGAISTGPQTHELTISCSSDGKWKHDGEDITSVSCVVSDTNDDEPVQIIESTTMVASTQNLEIPLCAQCVEPSTVLVSSIDQSIEDGTTSVKLNYDEDSCLHAIIACKSTLEAANESVTLFAATTSLISGTYSVEFNLTCNSAGAWMTASGTIVEDIACGVWNETSTTLEINLPSTSATTLVASLCSQCENLVPKSINPSEGYDGMMVLNHYTNSNGCREVEATCSPTENTENVTILFGSNVIATGASSHTYTLTCNSNGNWEYESSAVASVSCLISTAENGVTVAPTTTTTRSSETGCSECGRAPIESVGTSTKYTNGFTTVVQTLNDNSCSVVSIKCQGISSTQSSVAILSGGLPLSSGYGQTTLEMTCSSDGKWMYNENEITDLSCGQKQLSSTNSTTVVTPSGSCALCSNIQAIPKTTDSSAYDGMVIINHYIDSTTNCMNAKVSCGSTTSTENATIYLDSTVISTGSNIHNLDLTCNSDAEWIYDDTTVSTISCLVSDGTGDVVTISPTTASVTDSVNSLCSQCSQLPVDSIQESSTFNNYYNAFSTIVSSVDSYGCSIVEMSCEGTTDSENVQIVINDETVIMNGTKIVNMTDIVCNTQGKWTYGSYGTISSLYCIRNTEKVEQQPTSSTSFCSDCSNIRPKSKASDGTYDGLLVVTHYKDNSTQCRKAHVSCMPTVEDESVELLIEDTVVDDSEIYLTCPSTGEWDYEDSNIQTASCLVQNSTISKKRRRKRETGTGETACQSCSTLPLESLGSFYPYMNGFATLDVDASGECTTIEATCEGTTESDETAWIVSGTVISSGVGPLNISFSCNSMSSWETSEGVVFASISCGRKSDSSTDATTTTSSALNCSNLIVAAFTDSQLEDGEKNGQLILDYYDESGTEIVNITCYGSTLSDNTTLSFNGDSRTISSSGQIQISLECSASGQWMINGIGVETVACVTSGDGSGETATTPPPFSTSTIAGSSPNTNCDRRIISTVPSGYNGGYLTMSTESTEDSLSVDMSCSSPNEENEAYIVFADGTTLSSGSSVTNLTIECNSDSEWEIVSTSGTGVAIGTIVTTFSCAVLAVEATLASETVNPLCQECSNVDAIAVSASDLDSGETNGELILDHVLVTNNCRMVYITCVGNEIYENSTILFNYGSETMSNHGLTSTVLTCDDNGNWDWYGTTITTASCKVAANLLTSTTSTSATTAAVTVSEESEFQCNRSSLIVPALEGDTGAYLTIDTSIENDVLQSKVSCMSPTSPSESVLTNGDGTVLAQSEGVVNMTLTCNSQNQWVISSISPSESDNTGTVVDQLTCTAINDESSSTTSPTTTSTNASTTTIQGSTTTTTASAKTATSAGETDACSGATWQEWEEWGDCSDTCGACGTYQRFRECSTTDISCCTGDDNETEECNIDVCKYPRTSCCTGFSPTPVTGGTFVCKASSR